MMNPKEIKKDFPIFNRIINGNPLVYLDNAATTQKPKQVLEAIIDFYSNYNANVHRGIHTLSEEATHLYEQARKNIADFIGAPNWEEVVFTKGTTEALNRIASEWALKSLNEGDEILLTRAEHHSNLVPWQIVSQKTGAVIKFLEFNEQGEISRNEINEKINSRTKFVSVTHASNVLGSIFPVREIAKKAKEFGAIVAVDGAQAVPHMGVNVQTLGCDFYVFSGHKMLGPMGIGVLWGRKELLSKLDPYEYGGGMINTVTYEKSDWAQLPEKFEAGTPNVSGAIGVSAACDYLKKLGMENVRNHDIELNKYAIQKLSEIEDLSIMGPLDAEKRTGLVSFYIKNVHAHDVASVLNSTGVAVRSGHHCTMPMHTQMGISASTRASFYIYNTLEDIDLLVEGVKKAIKILG